MGSSATPFLPSACGEGQIGTFPTFPGGPLFTDDDGGLVTVAAFPPLAAFGFGTFCPTADQQQQPQQQQQQQQPIVHSDEQQQHLFLPILPIQSPFLGDAPLSRFAADETQMLVNMACGTFLTDCSELQHHPNYFPPPPPSANSDESFAPINQNPPPFFGLSNCAIDHQNSAHIQSASETLAAKNEKFEEESKVMALVHHHQQQQQQSPSVAARRGHQQTQRGGMRRRGAERMGKRKMAQNANNLLAAVITQSSPIRVKKCDEDSKDGLQTQQKLLLTSPPNNSDPMKPNLMEPIATVPSALGYSVPSTVVVDHKEMKQCALCEGNISDHVMLAVGKAKAMPAEFFHCECLKCSECAGPLENAPRCYVREGRTYCEECYSKIFFNIHCAMCDKRIGLHVWLRCAREFVYHVTCFKCEHCERQLITDEEYSLDDIDRPPPAIPRLLCKEHYMELVLGEQCNSKQKTKRVRTTFSDEQVNILQQNFKIDSNPDGADLERIAFLTGLSKRVTQVWFQNSRARQKKYHGHASCRKNGVPLPGDNGIGPGSNSASITSRVGMDTPSCLLGGCRSATLTPSSSSNGGGAYTAGQSPVLFGRGGSTGSESDGFRQLLSGGSALSPSAISGRELSSADASIVGEMTTMLQSAKKEEEMPKH